MTDTPEYTAETASAALGAGQFTLEQIYLKDCSFESPLSPAAFTEQYTPELNVNLQTQVNGLVSRPEAREVVLTATVDARLDEDKSLFVAEVHMGALVSVGEMPDEVQGHLLGSRVPASIFPYVREAISNLVVRGGFLPLMLQPVDFDAIYNQQVMQQGQALDG